MDQEEWTLESGGPGLNPGFTSVCLWVSHLTSVRLNFLICKMELYTEDCFECGFKLHGGFKALGMVPSPLQVLEPTEIGRQAREEQSGETGLPTGNDGHSHGITCEQPELHPRLRHG